MENALAIRNYIEDSFKSGNSSLCAQDVDNLKNWPLDHKLFKGVQLLTDEGYKEMYTIAKRLKSVYPNLLSNLKQGEYKFGFTSDEKIEESTKAYIEGFDDKGLNIDKLAIDDIIAVSGYGFFSRY
jgi:hypothetical protein